MNIRTEQVIDAAEWDNLVKRTYGRPYCFQQQDGGRERGFFRFTVPDQSYDEDMNDTVPEIVNHEATGVKFEVWKSRDPKEPLKSEEKGLRSEAWMIDLWWA